MELVDEFVSKVPGIILKIIKKQQNFDKYHAYLKKVESDLKSFQEHGIFPGHHTTSDGHADLHIKLYKKEPLMFESSKRTVLTENSQINIPQIKLERISEIPQNDDDVDFARYESEKENMVITKLDMAPPQLIIKRNKVREEPSIINVRSTRSKSKKQNYKASDDHLGCNSDVALERQVIERISIAKNNDHIKTNANTLSNQRKHKAQDSKCDVEEITTRTTRTKTRIKQANHVEKEERTRHSSNSGGKSIQITKPPRQMKHKKSEESCEDGALLYEDAEIKSIDGNIPQQKINVPEALQNHVQDATIISKEKAPLITNKTVLIEKPKVINGCSTLTLNDIMTEDEDNNIVVTLPKKINYSVKKGAKEIFSPFDGSPVKKRVEAFEQLGTEITSETLLHITRAKTKAKAKRKEEQTSTLTPKHIKENRDVKTTPRYLTTASISANKDLKINILNEGLKSLSNLKASQQEYQERENRRREKEAEAIKKREAQLQAQTEERKKKRLEKQMKAQQVREAQERSRILAIEKAEKNKEEKRKQMLLEQEKTKKQQEKSERRKQEVLKKDFEEKRKQEESQRAAEEMQEKLQREACKKALQEERKMANATENKKKAKSRLPIYLREKTPLLPTEDCYDSDQENDEVRKVKRPGWTSSGKILQRLQQIQCVDKNVIRSFFIMNITTPDLQDLFENIDPKKLKRTSSAIWRAPPRFTMIPQTIDEKDEEDY